MTLGLAKLLEKGLDHWALRLQRRLRADNPGSTNFPTPSVIHHAAALNTVFLAHWAGVGSVVSAGEVCCYFNVPNFCLIRRFKCLNLTAWFVRIGS